MIGTIAGAALNIGGAIFGGRAKRKAAKQQAKILAKQEQDNEAWYQRRYNEDTTQRADAQRALELTRQAMNEQYKRAKGSAAVTGASDESVAMQKAAANEVLAATTSNIVTQGEARKDAVEQQYFANKNALAAQRRGVAAAKGEATADAIRGVSGAAAGITDGLAGLFGK